MVKGGGVGGSALCIVGLKPPPPSVIIIPSRSSLVEVLSVLEARVCVTSRVLLQVRTQQSANTQLGCHVSACSS